MIGSDLYATADDLSKTLPGTTESQLFLPQVDTPPPLQPDPSLAQKRTMNNGVAAPASPRNSFPRLAVDSDGTVYLAFRHPVGQGLSSSDATGQDALARANDNQVTALYRYNQARADLAHATGQMEAVYAK